MGQKQGSGQNTPKIAKDAKRISRDLHKGMKPGGPMGTKKGDSGYTRKTKHKKKPGEADGGELTDMDETYRGLRFPLAFVDSLDWSVLPTIAKLDWSTHKAETFDDTGKNGEHPAWGFKSIIDRGVKPHEKSSGDKRIGEGEHQTQKRNIGGKSFKSYAHLDAFNW